MDARMCSHLFIIFGVMESGFSFDGVVGVDSSSSSSSSAFVPFFVDDFEEEAGVSMLANSPFGSKCSLASCQTCVSTGTTLFLSKENNAAHPATFGPTPGKLVNSEIARSFSSSVCGASRSLSKYDSPPRLTNSFAMAGINLALYPNPKSLNVCSSHFAANCSTVGNA